MTRYVVIIWISHDKSSKLTNDFLGVCITNPPQQRLFKLTQEICH